MSLLDAVMDGLGSDGLDSIGSSLGVDREATTKAMTAAVPLLLAGMSRYAEKPENAASLFSALEADHDGSIFDDVSGFVAGGGGGGAMDDGALDAMLGGRRESAARAIGGASGIDMAQATRLMTMAAPFVLGALGRARRSNNIQAAGLGAFLQGENDALSQRSAGSLGILTRALDTDGDGSIFDEISNMGSGLLNALRGK